MRAKDFSPGNTEKKCVLFCFWDPHKGTVPAWVSYVEQEDTREVINITEVNAKLETLIAEGNELNEKIEAIIKELGA